MGQSIGRYTHADMTPAFQQTIESLSDPAPIAAWLGSERRAEKPWVLAGAAADADAVASMRDAGALVMTLGDAFTLIDADIAYVLDAELILAGGEALMARARWLLVPGELNEAGWASGRSLQSWAADLLALRLMLQEGRVVRFDLWPSAPDGLIADLGIEDIPVRLLASGGVRRVLGVGLDTRRPDEPCLLIPKAGGDANGLDGSRI